MSMADGPGYGCNPDGSDTSGICDCLTCSIETITAALLQIDNTLNLKLNNACDNIDDCTDKILEKIKKRLEGPQYSCEECDRMVRNGLAGTLEYAVRCANQTCDECNTVCTLGVNTEGKCCNYCGSPNCKCENGECLPVEEEPNKPIGYIGWCNPVTKLVVVTRKDKPGPGVGWIPGPLADTESVAYAEAYAICSGIKEPKPPPQQKQPPGLPQWIPPQCNLADIVSGDFLRGASDAIAMFNRDGGGIALVENYADAGAFGVTVGDIGNTLWNGLRMIAGLPAYWTVAAQSNVPKLIGCTNQAFIGGLQLRSTVQMFERNSGVSFADFMLPYDYAMRAACPQRQISPDQAMAAYLSGIINEDECRRLWQIEGYCDPGLDRMIFAQRSKPIPLQLAQLRRRKLISESEYHGGMRQLGYLEQPVAENLFRLTEQVPTLNDITRLMVRDADDDTIEFWPESDKIFEKKYGKNLRKWAEFQGIPEEFAKLYWRAHWNIPAPGQLFTFLHRLRNDKKFNGDGKLLDRIKAALQQQDILPFWQEYFIATSYKPLTRIDVRRAYQIGAIDDARVRKSYTDLGYDDNNADALLTFSRRLRDEGIPSRREVKLWLRFAINRSEAVARMTKMGLPAAAVEQALDDESSKFITSPYSAAFVRGELSRDAFAQLLDEHGVKLDAINRIVELLSTKIRHHPSLDRYGVGVVERAEAKQEMQSFGILPAIAEKLLTDTDNAIYISFVKTCQAGIKKRFLLGELNQDEARNELIGRQTTNARANQMVDWWGCELKAGEKHVSASTLCQWLSQGAITATDFISRLKKIGYSEIDSGLMLQDCLTGISLKRMNQAKKEAKEHVSEQNRIASALRRQQKQIEKVENQRQTALTNARKKRAMREKQLLAAAEKLYKKCECTFDGAISAVKDNKARIISTYGLDIDEALQILILATEQFAGGFLSDYDSVVTALSELAVTAANESDSVELGTPPSTNGSTHPLS